MNALAEIAIIFCDVNCEMLGAEVEAQSFIDHTAGPGAKRRHCRVNVRNGQSYSP